jgi:hypothetical protein
MIARDFLPRLIELAVDQSIGTIRFPWDIVRLPAHRR